MALEQAIIDLDVDLMMSAVKKIGRIDASVSADFERLIQDFKYEKILALLQAAGDRDDGLGGT